MYGYWDCVYQACHCFLMNRIYAKEEDEELERSKIKEKKESIRNDHPDSLSSGMAFLTVLQGISGSGNRALQLCHPIRRRTILQ
jgi:hypothetical protein